MKNNTEKYQLSFIIFSPPFQPNVGGVIALYTLARIIDEAGFFCKVFDMNGINLANNIFDNYATKAEINENTVVVYPEVIFGNPLNAKHVVRWILCELGIHCPHDIYTTWGKDDFVYHYSTYNPQKDVKHYNILSPTYLNPALQNHGKSRNGTCHIIRKGHKFHKPLLHIHPSNSLLLDDNLSQEILIEIFNIKEYLISYDPYSYINFMAALCGCIPIVVPIKETSQKQWLESLFMSISLEQSGQKNELKGIAYGLEEVEYARKTLQEVRNQQDIFIQYGKDTVHCFINDMISRLCAKSDFEKLSKNAHILQVVDIFSISQSESSPEDIIKYYSEDFIANIIPKNIDENQKLTGYLKFLFSSQPYFQQIGDADNYCQYLQESINYLHTSIFKNLDSTFWHEVVNNFAQDTNFIPAYFNEINLKNIYVKRAEILELFLKLNSHELDYEFAVRPVNRKKIRLGILASHFTPSAETFAYLPVYEYISRDFEVILYSLSQTGHRLEQYCQLCANCFKLLPQELSAQVKTIRADDVDILFIATNVTAVTNQICLLVTHRLARIQVTSGGSVTTTGMRNMDYYISGTLTDPSPTAQDHYQENLVKLEGTAHCFSYGTEEESLTTPVDRNSLEIPEDVVVFISGANYFKTIPELIDIWAKIISKVPNSVLVLLPFGPNWSNNYPKIEFINHLNSIFSKHGVAAERLRVLDPHPVPDREGMKEYYKIADIYLDSYPFAGTTSLVEPLQVNLPVIARQGTTFRSAMGAAMVQALDVPNLVADSEESYIQLAIALGTDPELRQQKSAQIKEKMQGNPSFLDSRSYSAKIGSLFQELFSKYLADTLSQNFRLGNINLIIFPDWSQPEDLLYQDLVSAISTLTTHPDKSNITLLIDTQNISDEEADMLLSSLTMNLLMEDDVDITEGPEISLLGKMSDAQWKTLLPRINTRIALATDNQSAIAQAKAETLPSWDVDSLIAFKLEMTPV
ncbi:hypothetical protein LC608_07805 [Nostoc sp. XA010]|uniref:O-linked N-acetylglucosamine transferase, SPINDLY family protein n=1 Tax=Nostoc sp. XA010 TaxID=2780407 RepID=UPI001E543AD9|nr:hypothetical protein [Nostoc sp. XA010]MCC5656893.1 hypothetical protein [Nostoc sp. XA010]